MHWCLEVACMYVCMFACVYACVCSASMPWCFGVVCSISKNTIQCIHIYVYIYIYIYIEREIDNIWLHLLFWIVMPPLATAHSHPLKSSCLVVSITSRASHLWFGVAEQTGIWEDGVRVWRKQDACAANGPRRSVLLLAWADAVYVCIVTSLRQRRGLPKRHAGPRAPPKLAPRQDSNEGDLQNTCRQAGNILGVFSIQLGCKF